MQSLVAEMVVPKTHVDSSNTATNVAVASQPEKLAQTEADLRTLHDKAQDAIRALSVRVGEIIVNLPERREQKWHLTRPKDLPPSVLTKIEN